MPGSDTTALRELFTELLTGKEVVQRLDDLTAGTDVRYEMGFTDPHPAVGHFAPELELITGRRRSASSNSPGAQGRC